MKIFNVSLRVVITQIAEIPDNPPETAATDEAHPMLADPMDRQEKMLNKYMDRVERLQRGPVAMIPGFGVEHQDGASFSQNIKISAENYDDMAAVLKKFSDTAKSLQPIPEGLLTSAADPSFTPIR